MVTCCCRFVRKFTVCLYVVLTAFAMGYLSDLALAGDTPRVHIDTEAGIRFTVPFPIYQKKTGAQVENLIKDTFSGELSDSLIYSSAVYADDSDAYVVVWRQKISELPSRYQFKRFKFPGPLRSSSKISQVEMIEGKPVATFKIELPDDLKARVAMVLTKEENVFIGLYSKKEISYDVFKLMVTSIDVDPKRLVQWKDLDSGLKPVWSGLIVAIGFLLGFIAYFSLLNVRSRGRREHLRTKKKKSGEFSSPDRYKQESKRVPDGF